MKKIFLIAIIFMCSCQREQNNPNIEISLPDRVRVNETLTGYIKFRSNFDTITTSFYDTINFKTPWIYIYESQENRIDENKLVIKDSIRLFNNKIEIKNYSFKKSGEFYFLALLKDQIMLFHYNEKGQNDSIRLLSNEYFISKKIVVID